MSEEKKFTQEEFNDKLGELLAKKTKKYEDEIASKQTEIDGLNTQITELKTKQANFDTEAAKSAQTIKDLQSKIKGYETASVKRKVADELGLDSKAIEFIAGETEEEMKASAEKLKALTGSYAPPLATIEGDKPTNKIDDALKKMNSEIFKGN
jgi:chromosome segregation ATPase